MSEDFIEIRFMARYYFQENTDPLIKEAIVNQIRLIGSELIGEEDVHWSAQWSDADVHIGFDYRRDLYALHGYLRDVGWDRVLRNPSIDDPDRL